MLTREQLLAEAGVDGVALKPSECDVRRGADLGVALLTVDWEGREHLPTAGALADLADSTEVRLTTPVRADGFDPLGDDSLYEWLPAGVGQVLVAGHPAYLTAEERRRAVAPRLRAARERAPDAWVGTESIERLALATGGTQFELLSGTTESDLRGLRAAGVDAPLAVYAPTVVTDDEDAILDAVGAYVARRGPVAEALPDGAAVDGSATGRARELLLRAGREFALVGSPEAVRRRVDRLRAAGADRIVAYPARGVEAFADRN